MAILPTNLARVSNNLVSSVTQRNLTRTQVEMAEVQNQLSTGIRVNVPSDDPTAASSIISLKNTLAVRQAYSDNLTAAGTQLGTVDSSLSDLTDLLRQAQSIASANVGSTVSADERAAAATVIDNLYSQALSIANTQSNGSYLYGGNRAAQQPFISDSGGIRFAGSATVLQNAVDPTTLLPLQVSGQNVFGTSASQLAGRVDLTPALTATTRLSDLRGAQGNGVRLGTIQLSNGTTTANIDLSHADTINDVVNAINAANVGGIQASLTATGLTLTAGGSDQISVKDLGGTTAADLGIAAATPLAAGATLAGQQVDPVVTPLTKLADLRGGLGIDQAGGLLLSNGAKSVLLDLSTMTTVQDLQNAINSSGTGAAASISADGAHLDISNSIQGLKLTIGPGASGGTAADDLGIRTLTPASLLSSLNGGQGVRLTAGNDMQITRANGSTFQVDLSNASTVQDAIDAINLADGGGGVTASFDSLSNRLILSDSTGAAGPRVTSLLNSQAAEDLGLDGAPVAGVLQGKDVGALAGSGIFANLAALRDALLHNDPSSITSSSASLQDDLNRVIRIRGQAGAVAQEVSSRQTQMEDQNTSVTAMISQLQDVDYNQAITKFQTLQTALQANLQSAGKILSQSLLDFLS